MSIKKILQSKWIFVTPFILSFTPVIISYFNFQRQCQQEVSLRCESLSLFQSQYFWGVGTNFTTIMVFIFSILFVLGIHSLAHDRKHAAIISLVLSLGVPVLLSWLVTTLFFIRVINYGL